MQNPIIVALDVPSAQKALKLAEELASVVGAFKVGKQLFVNGGPDVVRKLRGMGVKTFLDLLCMRATALLVFVVVLLIDLRLQYHSLDSVAGYM